MNTNKDWETLNQYIQDKKDENNKRYKIDIEQEYTKMMEKQNKQKAKKIKISFNTIIKIIVILLIALIIISYNTVKQNLYHIENISIRCNEEVIEISHIANPITGNGFYTYNVVSNPNIEIHAVFLRQ